MVSIKISNAFEYKNELLRRLRGVNSPGKRLLVQNIKKDDWKPVVKELLYRAELYADYKVINYRRSDLNQIVGGINLHGIDNITDTVYDTYYPELTPEQIGEQFIADNL